MARGKRLELKSIILATIIAILAVPMLTACVPQNYWIMQGRETKKLGKEMLDKYLSERYSDYKLEDIQVVSGAKEGEEYFRGSYLTRCVSANLYVGDEEYDICVDTETGTIYTEELKADVKEYIYEELKPYFIKYGFTGEYVVDRLFMPISIINHNVKNKNEIVNTEFALSTSFPSDLDVNNLSDYLENNKAEDEFTAIWIAYWEEGENVLPEGIYKDFVADHAYLNYIRLMKLSKEDFITIKNGGWYDSDMELLDDTHYTQEKKDGVDDVSEEY